MRVRKAFADQARWCAALGSPFTARLMSSLGVLLDKSTQTGRRILTWQGQPDARGDAVPLRLAGALHALVRRERLPGLAAFYPPNPLPDEGQLGQLAMAAIVEADKEVEAWLDYAPQTNEVARSAYLYPGMMVVARETGLPISLFEVGASAGLNLFSDQFSYSFAGMSFGKQGTAVSLRPEWQGPLPMGAEPKIVGRKGCDLNPLDVREAQDRERLVAYVWPDQPDRIERLQAAIELARGTEVAVERAEAAQWLEDRLDGPGTPGEVRLVYHTIAFQYFPEPSRRRIETLMARAGAQSTRQAPLAWLYLEPSQEGERPSLTLRLWPSGTRRILARGDAHGRRIEWLGVEAAGNLAST